MQQRRLDYFQQLKGGYYLFENMTVLQMKFLLPWWQSVHVNLKDRWLSLRRPQLFQKTSSLKPLGQGERNVQGMLLPKLLKMVSVHCNFVSRDLWYILKVKILKSLLRNHKPRFLLCSIITWISTLFVKSMPLSRSLPCLRDNFILCRHIDAQLLKSFCQRPQGVGLRSFGLRTSTKYV